MPRPARLAPLLAVLLGLSLATAAAEAAAQEAEVVVRVGNAVPGQGDLRIALYDSAASFDAVRDPVAAAVIRAAGEGAAVSLAPLPPGRYAIRVFQDLNRNGQLDRTLLGMPREPIGFSNDAIGTRGPPDFAAAAVELAPGRTEVTIRLLR